MTAGENVQSGRYVIPAVVRAVEILRLFSADRRLVTAPEMAQELDIPRSTVFRLAQTLESLGILEREKGGHAYRLGIGVLRIGFEYLASLDLTEIARPFLESLRDATGLSAHLVVRDGDEVVVVLKAVGMSAFSGSLNVGARLPAHATVLGRVLLADLEPEDLRVLYGDRVERLPVYTKQTPHTVEELEAVLAEDRTRGYAVSESFFESGISAVAAPVRDERGGVVAAINLTVPSAASITDDLVARVRETADEISGALNYRPHGDLAVNF
ncbi:MAG: IclR family transcriptional regulator [Alphaproteobacteria bacterium]|nr:IclR family transcriptional regulator [Alphaproteobacteria bacterium]